MSPPKIKRALISVYDKTGIVDFARTLHSEFGIEIISTGGTAKLLEENDIPVTLVEEVTGFPEMMGGRVKTLHPKIHAGILADRDNPEHMRQLKKQGIQPIDMVVVNLYPFEKTVADPDCTLEQAIEMIDIGGPCMLRAAAKNHKHVLPAVHSRSHEFILDALREEGDLAESARACLASIAFEATAEYDDCVESYLSKRWCDLRKSGYDSGEEELRNILNGGSVPASTFIAGLRYGENPHQSGWAEPSSKVSAVVSVIPDELAGWSYNNLADADAAARLCNDLTRELGECGAGFQPVGVTGVAHDPSCVAPGSSGMTPGSSCMTPGSSCVAPASSRWAPVEGDNQTERNLPHLETTGRTYFVTFRTRKKNLSNEARQIVLDACRFWHGRQMNLHAVVVMPDHVHALITPFETASGGSVSLGKLIHSIKSFSANGVNKLGGGAGSLWLDERWDRIMRHEKEFLETWEYIQTNPARAGLETDYQWFWNSNTNFEESGLVENGGRSDHRLEAGATQEGTGATQEGTGATQEGTGTTQEQVSGSQGEQIRPICVFIKHTNSCGTGVADDPIEAYRRAYIGDPNAAMGGILACSFDVNAEFAEAVMNTYARWGKEAGVGGFFIEVWVAPSFDDDALKIIRESKKWGERVRLFGVGSMSIPPSKEEVEYKSISGGLLKQTRDNVGLNEDQWKIATKRQPTGQELGDLRLAWLVAKHTKSNAISVCKDGMLIGNGAGQMSRVMSCRIATWLAKDNGHEAKLAGSVAASDAFFPFSDGPSILMDAGVSAIIQPGGSKRDEDTIKACDERGVAMILTGTRHFKH